MTTTLTRADLDDFKAEFMRELVSQFAPIDTVASLDKLRGWQGKLQLDGSFGRILNGPQWIDNVAIRDGVITADKLTANFVIANTFTSSATGTGARFELTATGFKFWDATTLRSQLLADGSFFFGSTAGTAATAALSGTTGATVAIGNTMTIASGGKIIDGDGSFWDQSGITLVSSGSYGDVIKWTVSGSNKGSITADTVKFGMQYGAGAGASVLLAATTGELGFNGFAYNTLFPGVFIDSATGFAEIQSGNASQRARFGTSGNLSLYGKLYPGISSNTYQTTGYYDWNSGSTAHRFAGGGLQVAGKLYPADQSTGLQSIIGLWVNGSTSNVYVEGGQFYFNNAPTLVSASGATGSTFSPTHYWSVFDNAGAAWYIPLFSAHTPWAA